LTNPKSQINTISEQPKKKNTQNRIGRMKKEVAAEQEEGGSSSNKKKMKKNE
jgi:ribosome-interacting GTPase 1